MTEQRPSKVVHPRLDPNVYERLARWAEHERRSLSQAVSILIERALDAEDRK
jgi:hypothetical protein